MDVMFQNLLSASLYGSIVIMAVLILRLMLKKAPKSALCLLWLLAGLRLVLPFEIESRLSLQPDVAKIAHVQAAREEEPVQSAQASEPQMPGESEIPAASETPALPDTENLPADVEIVVGDAAVSDHRQVTEDYAAVAAWVWVAGMAALGAYSLWSYGQLKRRVREAVCREERYWECGGIDTAFVLGFLPPKIYLPMGLGEKDKQLILAHEHAHIARGDHWVKPVGYLILMLHWFNPLVWVAYACLCRDIEMACDERVVRAMDVEQRKDYSKALLSCSSRRLRIAACPVAFGEVGMKQRIITVLNYRKPGFWVTLVAVVAVIFVVVCLMTSPAAQADADSLLNYENAIELAENRQVVIATKYQQNINGSLSICKAEGAALAQVLEDAGWQDWLVGKSHDGFTAYVDFQLTEDLKVRIFDNGHGDLILGEEIRHYRVSKSVYEEAEALLSDATGQDVQAAAEEMNAPVWNLTMSVKHISAGGLTVVFAQTGDFPGSATGQLQYGSEYYLERWNGSGWEAVPYAQEGETAWTMLAYGIELNAATAQNIDWSWLYGELSPGRYRITKGVTLFFEAGNYKDADFTAEFYLDGQQGADTWGLTLDGENVTNRGMTLVCHHEGEESGEIITGEAYSLYAREGDGWVPVTIPQKDVEWIWTDIAWLVNLNGETRWDVNWEWLYGQLSDGVYCLEKQFIRGGENGETEYLDMYMQFAVGASQTGEDITDENRYLAMCRTALKEFQAKQTGYVAWENQFYNNSRLESHVTGGYWFDGGNWLRRADVERGGMTRWHLGAGGSVYFKVEDAGPAESSWTAATTEGVDAIQPWLYSLNWDAQEIALVGAENTGTELQVTILVQGAPPGIPDEDVTEYTVCFVFGKNGALTKTIHTYEAAGTKGISTMTIATSAEESPADMIADACEKALGYTPKTAEEYLAMCRAALKEFQAMETVAVTLVGETDCSWALENNWESRQWYDGEDWLREGYHPQVNGGSYDYWLEKDGICYKRGFGNNGDGGGPYDTGWYQVDSFYNEGRGDWLTTPNWDEANLTFRSYQETEDGCVIICGAEIDPEHAWPDAVADCRVEFYLDGDGTLVKAAWITEFTDGGKITTTDTISQDSPETIRSAIEEKYREAVSDLSENE